MTKILLKKLPSLCVLIGLSGGAVWATEAEIAPRKEVIVTSQDGIPLIYSDGSLYGTAAFTARKVGWSTECKKEFKALGDVKKETYTRNDPTGAYVKGHQVDAPEKIADVYQKRLEIAYRCDPELRQKSVQAQAAGGGSAQPAAIVIKQEPSSSAQELIAQGTSSLAQGDYETAKQAFQTAANLGSAEAMFELGKMHRDGKGFPINATEAAFLYAMAANKGFAKAQHNLAAAYFKGVGVEENKEEARAWFEKAAAQGFSSSQKALKDFWPDSRVTAADLRRKRDEIQYKKAAYYSAKEIVDEWNKSSNKQVAPNKPDRIARTEARMTDHKKELDRLKTEYIIMKKIFDGQPRSEQ